MKIKNKEGQEEEKRMDVQELRKIIQEIGQQ